MAKILIVDDDPDVVEASRLLLEKQGHTIACAYNRDEGMKAVDDEKPDLLILDVMMDQPDDGVAMAQQLRRNGFGKPILMLTSIGRVTGMEFGRDDDILPVDDFQEKPVDGATLSQKVTQLLEKGTARC
jgi:DNA-binding response OmpR family regulator